MNNRKAHWMSRLSIIDLSHHNAAPNWGKAKAYGLIGVILKATEGTGYEDNTFQQRRANASASGLIVASYHFLKPGQIQAQVQNYLDAVRPVRGERMVIDYEDPRCTIDDLHAFIIELRRTKLDLQITVYAGHLLKEHLGGAFDPLLASTSLWISHYTAKSGPTMGGLSPTWPHWTLWQYSDGMEGGQPRQMPGFTGAFDCNVFNGSDEACRLWLSPAKEPVVSPPHIEAMMGHAGPEVSGTGIPQADPVAEMRIMLESHEARLRVLEGN